MGMVCDLLVISPQDLGEFTNDSKDFAEFLYNEEDQPETVTLDKSWQTIHFALTGTEWDNSTILGQAIMGGTEFGDDMGYGPARFHNPDMVKKYIQSSI